MADIRDGLLRSIEAIEAKAASTFSPSLKRAYLDLADHYRSRLRNGHSCPRA